MEVETLVEWMLRRREEMTRAAATDGVIRHTVQYLNRKSSNCLPSAQSLFAGPQDNSLVGFRGNRMQRAIEKVF